MLFKQSLRFFRPYHSVSSDSALTLVNHFMLRPEFVQARAKNYVNLYHMQSVDKDVLNETLHTLFSKENAGNTLKALDRGDFSIDKLLRVDTKLRQSYLAEFEKNSGLNLDAFEKQQRTKEEYTDLDKLEAQFTRK